MQILRQWNFGGHSNEEYKPFTGNGNALPMEMAESG
jgi:hypothetical protein